MTHEVDDHRYLVVHLAFFLQDGQKHRKSLVGVCDSKKTELRRKYRISISADLISAGPCEHGLGSVLKTQQLLIAALFAQLS